MAELLKYEDLEVYILNGGKLPALKELEDTFEGNDEKGIWARDPLGNPVISFPKSQSYREPKGSTATAILLPMAA